MGLDSGFQVGRDPFLGAVRMGRLTAHQGICWLLEGCRGAQRGVGRSLLHLFVLCE